MEKLLSISLILFLACYFDIKKRKIPNNIVAIGITVSLVFEIYYCFFDLNKNFSNVLNFNLKGMCFGLLTLMPLYIIRACGAGDVKLMAMVGSFVGPDVILSAAVYTLIAGGIIALFFMLGRDVAAKTIENTRFLLTDWLMRVSTGGGAKLAPLEKTAARLPYAVAITMGTGAALWMQHR